MTKIVLYTLPCQMPTSILRLTDIAEPYLHASSEYTSGKKKIQKSVLESPLIETRHGHVQCLRFCFNAFTRSKTARRSLDVWMQYMDNSTKKMENTKHMLFNFSSLNEEWGLYWNHTEVNIRGNYNKYYKVCFALGPVKTFYLFFIDTVAVINAVLNLYLFLKYFSGIFEIILKKKNNFLLYVCNKLKKSSILT